MAGNTADEDGRAASRSTAPRRPPPASVAGTRRPAAGTAAPSRSPSTGARQPLRRRRDLLHRRRRGAADLRRRRSPSGPRARTRSRSGARTPPATSRPPALRSRCKIDTTAPTTTVINPISPDSGWFVTSGIPVAFDADRRRRPGSRRPTTRSTAARRRPTASRSPPTCPPARTPSPTGASTSPATSRPRAPTPSGQRRHRSPPTITGTARRPAPNGFGWNNTDVDVTFTCADADSGIRRAWPAAPATPRSPTTAPARRSTATRSTSPATAAAPTSARSTSTRPSPTLVGVPADPNGAGWYKGDVTVTWVGDDALSGIDPATQPADSTVTGEGRNLGAGPVTIKDKAGNTSDPASVSGIKIDRTAPVITGAPDHAAERGRLVQGRGHRRLHLHRPTCHGRLGVACPTSKLLKGDGAEPERDQRPGHRRRRQRQRRQDRRRHQHRRHRAEHDQQQPVHGQPTATAPAPPPTWCSPRPTRPACPASRRSTTASTAAPSRSPRARRKTVSVPLSGSGAGTVKY